jgi:hypothetical protein
MIWTASSLTFEKNKQFSFNREEDAIQTMTFAVKDFPNGDEVRLAFVRRGDQAPEIIPPQVDKTTGDVLVAAGYAPPESGFIPCFGVDVEDADGEQKVEVSICVFERQTGLYDLFAWTISSLEDGEEVNHVCVFENALEIKAVHKKAITVDRRKKKKKR